MAARDAHPDVNSIVVVDPSEDPLRLEKDLDPHQEEDVALCQTEDLNLRQEKNVVALYQKDSNLFKEEDVVDLLKKRDLQHQEDDQSDSAVLAGRRNKKRKLSSSGSDTEVVDNSSKAKVKYRCAACAKSFSVKANLKTHQSLQRQLLFRCLNCKKSSLPPGRPTGSERGAAAFRYPCRLCDKSFPTAVGLYHHGRVVHPRPKAFPCPLCRESFHRPDSLELHMIVHTGDNSMVCSICGRLLQCEKTYRRHVRIHEAPEKKKPDTKAVNEEQAQRIEMMARRRRRRRPTTAPGMSSVSSNRRPSYAL